MTAAAPCGTYGGYQRHRRRGEQTCQPCRDAAARYSREQRKDPEFYARDLARSAARQRALERLAREYPERFQALLAEERAPIYAPGAHP